MTNEQARTLANECVNTLIDAGVLEESKDFFALDLITDRLRASLDPDYPKNHEATPR
jgi:hypothetical protein